MHYAIIGIVVAAVAVGAYIEHRFGSKAAAAVSVDVAALKADMAAVKARVEAAEAAVKK